MLEELENLINEQGEKWGIGNQSSYFLISKIRDILNSMYSMKYEDIHEALEKLLEQEEE